MVLTSLTSLFELQTDYRVVQASDAAQAIAELHRRPIDVIVSDFLMPGMNGIEFLARAKSIQPEASRLLLTGYADKENAVRAINDVGLYHYIEKPWDNDSLLNIVKNALEEKGLRRQLTEKVRLLDRLATQHSTLEGEHQQLQRELAMAARVQMSLIPQTLPALSNFELHSYYQPCAAIGGDYFDLHDAAEDTLLVVADVVGHGVQASLTTMLLKGVFQEEAERQRDPGRLLAGMNSRLHRIMPEHLYAAAAVIRLPHRGERVVYSNAGIPYPFILRKARCELDECVLAGPPLGMFADDEVEFECRQIDLQRDDLLVIGSDGIGSIEAASGDYFDDYELRNTLGELCDVSDGAAVLESLTARAFDFGGHPGTPLPDDVSLVAARKRS